MKNPRKYNKNKNTTYPKKHVLKSLGNTSETKENQSNCKGEVTAGDGPPLVLDSDFVFVFGFCLFAMLPDSILGHAPFMLAFAH